MKHKAHSASSRRYQWPTWATLGLCYGLFAISTTWVAAFWMPLGVVLAVLSIALHSSLTHEVMHGHPFKNIHLNAALVFPALSFTIPYMRFRDTHLAHHVDSRLTDPYDDPESCYLDPKVWSGLNRFERVLLIFNNTLIGRLVVGPAIGQYAFMRSDLRLIKAGDRCVLVGWIWHIPAVALPFWWIVEISAMPVWAYLIAVYFGLSILKIRTYLEHRAHTLSRGRTVIIEDRGILAFLFLNNNFHSVHHMHPDVCWYDLPVLYESEKERFLAVNECYHYRSYGDVFRRYFFKAKEPVAHPLWSSEG